MAHSEEQLHRMIENADTLLRAGKSPEWIRDQWIDSGTPAALADQLMNVVRKDLPKARRRTKIKFGALFLGGPILVFATIFGLVKLVPYLQGPDAIAEARSVTFDACGQRGSPTAIDLGIETIILSGEGFSGPDIVSDETAFGDAVLTDRELDVRRVLCGEVEETGSIECEGYFSDEALAVLEVSDSLDEALALAWGTSEDAQLTYTEISNGGTTIVATGSVFTVRMVAVATNTEMNRVTIDVDPECPDGLDTYPGSLSTPVHRTEPSERHTGAAIAELIGVDLD